MHTDEEGAAFARTVPMRVIDPLYGWSEKIPTFLPRPTITASLDREDFMAHAQPDGQDHPRIERSDIRGFTDKAIADLIVQCINYDGCTYRLTDNGVILRPLDGTPAITLAARSGGRQRRDLQRFYDRHVGPVAHPENYPDHDHVTITPADVHVAPIQVASVTEVTIDKITEAGEWHPYVNSSDEVDPRFEVHEGKYRCVECADSAEPFVTDAARSLAGHYRLKHSDDRSMWTPEAREKALDSRRYNPLREDALLCIEILSSRLGVPYRDEIAQLKAENADLKAQLAIIREAVGLQ